MDGKNEELLREKRMATFQMLIIVSLKCFKMCQTLPPSQIKLKDEAALFLEVLFR